MSATQCWASEKQLSNGFEVKTLRGLRGGDEVSVEKKADAIVVHVAKRSGIAEVEIIPPPKGWTSELSVIFHKFGTLENFDHASIEQAFRSLVAELQIKAGELVHPVRAALTGKTIGPGLFELIEVLGKPRTEQRLRKFIR